MKVYTYTILILTHYMRPAFINYKRIIGHTLVNC